MIRNRIFIASARVSSFSRSIVDDAYYGSFNNLHYSQVAGRFIAKINMGYTATINGMRA